MTRNEKKEFKKWNISICIEQDNARKKAGEIEQKYLELNGKRSCNPERFLYEIVTTNGVEVEEKISDMMKYVDYIKGEAKAMALSDILHIYR